MRIRALCLLGLLLTISCVSPNRKTHSRIVQSGKPGETIHCLEPPPDIYTPQIKASLDASSDELKSIVKANISVEKKIEKIREVLPGLQTFEVLEYRFCTMYANGVIDKERYNELIDHVLPLIVNQEYGGEHGGLKIVDAKLIESDSGFVTLDVKLRNTGAVAFIKTAVFDVEKTWSLIAYFMPHAIPVSWQYDVLLPIEGAPYQKTIDVSQAVKNGDVDRFTFRLGHDSKSPNVRPVYKLKVKLVYDEDDKTLLLPPIIMLSPSPWEISALVLTREVPEGIVEHNKKVTSEIYDECKGFQGLMNFDVAQKPKRRLFDWLRKKP